MAGNNSSPTTPEGSTAGGGTTKASGGKRQLKKKSKTLRNSLLALLLVIILIPFVAFGIGYTTATVPKPGELETKQVTEIYASDSTTELARIVPPEGNRREVSLDTVPEDTRHAVLAAEDREFYSNNGFSITGFARAALGQITGNASAGGGSTITQQYVKKMVVGEEYSYTRKAKELVYSVKMANEWSKDQVLEAYLNTIYFGRNAYGIDAAAQAYFGIPASQLDVSQSAVLAASIQRPSQLDPWYNREEAEDRWNYVLDGMVSSGWLDATTRANLVYPETIDPTLTSAYTEAEGTNGHIKNQVMSELASVGITEEDVETKGLRVTTTIDPQVQNATVDAVRSNLEGESGKIRMAAVSIEPATGAVRGYYGGEDATGYDYANAALQTGSTFKVFGLTAAVAQGIPTSTYYSSDPYTLPGGITVTNDDGGGCGACSIKTALLKSYNTSFLRLQDDLENGTQDTADMAHKLGVAESLPGIDKTLTENGGQPYEGVILGQYQSRPLDMAHALATLANYGVRHDAYFVEKVETAEGEVLYQHDANASAQEVVPSWVATNVLDAMLPIASYSNGNVLAGGRQSAAKTGTAQLGDTGYNKDAWMIGATPQLATAVWAGTDDNSPLLNSWGGLMYGSGLPASTWKDILDGALEDKPNETFKPAEEMGFYKEGSYGQTWSYYDNGSGYSDYTEGTATGGTATGGTADTAVPDAPAEQVAPVDPGVGAGADTDAGTDTGGGVEILPGVVIPGELIGQ